MVNDQDLIDKYEELQTVKADLKKVNYKGYALLFGLLLVGFTIGFMVAGGFS